MSRGRQKEPFGKQVRTFIRRPMLAREFDFQANIPVLSSKWWLRCATCIFAGYVRFGKFAISVLRYGMNLVGNKKYTEFK